jgi:ABC-type branched-subunit amino acid transport system ATPase component
MPRIRKVEIRNFRSIQSLDWFPSGGINCLIGPGDSGKSTVLDAIDLCLGARRLLALSDTDFYGLDATAPISVTLTLGELPDQLLGLPVYGDYLRAFNPTTLAFEDEPRHGWETVLMLTLTVGADLEPIWRLQSDRAAAAGLERGIAWKDRLLIAPARLGNQPNSHLGWARGSILNRLAAERADLGPELVDAARQARVSFGERAGVPLGDTLATVTRVAINLGIPVGASAKALLDAHAVAIGEGAIALHNHDGIPLRSLGTGSARLLVAGLQREAAAAASIALVDEVEFGLEPHRLTRLMESLGAKEAQPPLQVFMTSHSPVAVRELRGDQICVTRRFAHGHSIQQAGVEDAIQATLRSDPEAFLAKTIILCEGASEVGLVHGLDIWGTERGARSLLAAGATCANFHGSDPNRGFVRGLALLRLGYRVIVVVDNDVAFDRAAVHAFADAGGRCITWQDGRSLEDELFLSLDANGVAMLLDRAIALNTRDKVAAQIQSFSENRASLAAIQAENLDAGIQAESRQLLGKIAHKKSWFKTQSIYEDVGREIVGPSLAAATENFRQQIVDLFTWAYAA